MLKTFRLIRSDIAAKARWLYHSDDLSSQLKAATTDGTTAMVLYRLMQGSRRRGLSPLEMVFNKLNVVVGGAIIGRGADFGEEFVLIHAQGVVINGAVRGGKGVHIEHQVTIGAEGRTSPVLGDNVFIGAGAKLVGPVNVGSGARVGANAVVVHDVAENTTVVGVPAKPVQRKSAD
jgi:serine O-acetyltransferase